LSGALDLRIFSYGTLQFDAVMEAVVGRCFEAVPARLYGYERRVVSGQNYPAIVRNEEKFTEGTLFGGLDPETLVRLDLFEGSLYRRDWVRLETGVGAWAYVVAPGKQHLLSNRPWQPDVFLQEHAEAFIESCQRFREERVE
jgi:gamma-glutamylcyclotransferase (GGCT)/AIG2-like uncharacterized protein YtfP